MTLHCIYPVESKNRGGILCFSRQSKRRTLGKDPPPRVRNVTLSPWLENTDFSDALGLAQEKRDLSDNLTG